jgi:hypothetical protein
MLKHAQRNLYTALQYDNARLPPLIHIINLGFKEFGFGDSIANQHISNVVADILLLRNLALADTLRGSVRFHFRYRYSALVINTSAVNPLPEIRTFRQRSLLPWN